jgi:hypothetical protein
LTGKFKQVRWIINGTIIMAIFNSVYQAVTGLPAIRFTTLEKLSGHFGLSGYRSIIVPIALHFLEPLVLWMLEYVGRRQHRASGILPANEPRTQSNISIYLSSICFLATSLWTSLQALTAYYILAIALLSFIPIAVSPALWINSTLHLVVPMVSWPNLNAKNSYQWQVRDPTSRFKYHTVQAFV